MTTTEWYHLWDTDALQSLLVKHVRNMQHLSLQAADYGIAIPLPLQNDLAMARAAIAAIEGELSARGESSRPQLPTAVAERAHHYHTMHLIREAQEAWYGVSPPSTLLTELSDLRTHAKREADSSTASLAVIGPEPRKRIEIVLKGNFQDLTTDIQAAMIRALAAIAETAIEDVKILTVMSGSIRLTLELPAPAAERLVTLFRDQHAWLVELGVESITLDQPSLYIADPRLLGERTPPSNRAEPPTNFPPRRNEPAQDIYSLSLRTLVARGEQELWVFQHQRSGPFEHLNELSRRALQAHNSDAMSEWYRVLLPLIEGWIRQHPSVDKLDLIDEVNDIASEVILRLLQYVRGHEDQFGNFSSILAYMKTSVYKTIRQRIRVAKRPESTNDADNPYNINKEDGVLLNDLWDKIVDVLKDDNDQVLAYERFVLGMSVNDIFSRHTDLWSDKETILSRLQRIKRILQKEIVLDQENETNDKKQDED